MSKSMLRGTLSLWFAIVASTALAQPNDLNLGSFGAGDGAKVFASAVVHGGETPMLAITAEMAPGWYIYSTTQKQDDGIGPKETVLQLAPSEQFELAGPFVPYPRPKVVTEPLAYGDLPIEKHEGSVTWIAPLKLANGLAAESVKITGQVDALACSSSSCEPQSVPFESVFSSEPPAQSAAGAQLPPSKPNRAAAEGVPKFTAEGVTLTGRTTKVSLKAGERFDLRVTVMPDAGWHAYALEEANTPEGISMPGQFVVTDSGGLSAGTPIADQQFKEKHLVWPEGGIDRYYLGPVTWTIPIGVPADAAPGLHLIQGVIGYQACADDESGCKQPTGAEFAVDVYVGEAPVGGNGEVLFAALPFREVREIATEMRARGISELPDKFVRGTAPTVPGMVQGNMAGDDRPNSGSKLTMAAAIPLAFLGGFILNFMPCVLPVIGLKVMSFVNQAGQHRSRILALNFWFVVGLISVFMALACLAAFLNLGWGDQFQSPGFQVVLIAIVFVFALSMLGVWEVPLPGFVGSGKAADLANQEGVSGAFFKGMLSTVLATPCLAPFISPVIGWAVGVSQATIFLVFFTIGLGMASPYLVIAAFPKAINLLPKPGAWMDTFKHLMGFVLLFTLAYLFAVLRPDLRVPTFVFIIALWAGCWWIGRVSLTENLWRKVRAYAFGWGFAAIVGFGAFAVANYLDVVEQAQAGTVARQTEGSPGEANQDGVWEYFTPERLTELRDEGKPTLIDFTASWCFTCQTNKITALYREDVKHFMKEHGIVGLKADKSEPAPDVDKLLLELGQASKGIPFYAVYPAGQGEPILMEGILTQGRLLAALEKAVQSSGTGGQVVQRSDARSPIAGN